MEKKTTEVPLLLALVVLGSTIPLFSMITTHAMDAVDLSNAAQQLHPVAPFSAIEFRAAVRRNLEKMGTPQTDDAATNEVGQPHPPMPPPCNPQNMNTSASASAAGQMPKENPSVQRHPMIQPPLVPKNPKQLRFEMQKDASPSITGSSSSASQN